MQKFPNLKTVLLPGLIGSALVIAGCGSGGGSSDEVEDTTSSRGIITGFGSVYVNGVKYETDDAEFEIDDSPSSEDDLRIGMIVTISGEIDANGNTGRASHIHYENELKGPISNIVVVDATTKTITVLGQQVEVNASTTFDDDHGLSFDNMTVGDVVEISGFTTQNGLTATHIEKQDNDEDIEIIGTISNLTANSFDINGFPVTYDVNTEIDDDLTLADGRYVEVEGRLNNTGTVLIAEEIESENKGLGDDRDEAEIQGIIMNFDPIALTFDIQGQVIDASNAVLTPLSLALADGLTVEAEGELVNGVLIAKKVKLKGQKIKIDAILSEVNAASGTITISFNGSDVIVRVNAQTEMEDDILNGPLTVADLNIGDYVEVEAFNDGSSDINAIKLKRRTPDKTRVTAPVESFDEASQSVTLLGISFDLGNATYEDDDDNNIAASTFYAALSPGVFVKLKDDDSNGIFEKAELEDED